MDGSSRPSRYSPISGMMDGPETDVSSDLDTCLITCVQRQVSVCTFAAKELVEQGLSAGHARQRRRKEAAGPGHAGCTCSFCLPRTRWVSEAEIGILQGRRGLHAADLVTQRYYKPSQSPRSGPA
jgi:hypothetical protein